MSEEYICPLGCLIRVRTKLEIEIHNQQHLTNILTLLRYRGDLVAPAHVQTYDRLVVLIEEGMRKLSNALDVVWRE